MENQRLSNRCVHKQPSAKHCFVCGVENTGGLGLSFYDDGESTVESHFKLSDTFQGYPGIAHGGILATILDEVVGRSIMSRDHHHFMMTVNMKVQFRKPVPTETPIKAVGRILKLKGRLAKVQGQIILPDGSIACDAEMTMADMPTEMASESRLAALGWEVIPD